MDADKRRLNLEEEIKKCVKCGTCLSVCPIFSELRREPAGARAKITLIEATLQGELSFTRRFIRYISQCLYCGKCAEACPNGAAIDEVVQAVRAKIVMEKGLGASKWLLLRVILRIPVLLGLLLRSSTLLGALIMKRIPQSSGLRLRFPLPLLNSHRLIPRVAPEFFGHKYGGILQAENERLRVGIFIGCIINYLLPEIGSSIIPLLLRQGVTLIIPEEQGCCGLPAYGTGDLKTTTSLARRNQQAFTHQKLDYIITICTHCGVALKKYYPLLLNNSSGSPLGARIVDIAHFLVNILNLNEITHPSPLNTRYSLPPPQYRRAGATCYPKITYHDPCHLKRIHGVYQEPRTLLQQASKYKLVEMENPDYCCGSGGTLNFTHYGLSLKILDKLLAEAQKTGAEILTTGCVVCLLHLRDGLYRRGSPMEAFHYLQLI